jgi:hypothetical protein
MPDPYDEIRRQQDSVLSGGKKPGDYSGPKAFDASDLQKVSAKESNKAKNMRNSRQEAKEKAKLAPEHGVDLSDDAFWKDDKEKYGPRKGWRKKAAGGGIAALVGGGLVTGIFILSSGPLQMLHFGQLLQQFHFTDSDDFGNGRASRLIQYARTRDEPEKRNLEYFGNKIADSYTAKLRDAGIEFDYNNQSRIRKINIDIDPTTGQPTTDQGRQALARFEAEGIPISQQTVTDRNGVTRRVQQADLVGSRAKVRRVGVSASVDVLGLSGVSSAMGTRLLNIRSGVSLHPLQNLARASDEKFWEWANKQLKKQGDYVAEGTKPTAEQASLRETDPDSDAPEPTQAEVDGTQQTADGTTEMIDTASAPDGTPRIKANAIKALGAGVGAASLVALTCGIQQLGEQAGELQSANVIRPLIRNGMQIISISSQIQTGQDLNLEELGALSASLYDEVSQSAWNEAESIQAELGHPNVGEVMPAAAIPGVAKPLFFDQLDDILATVGGGYVDEVCGAVSSDEGNIALTVGGILASTTGPVSFAVAAVSEVIQQKLATEFGDDLVNWIAGDPINPIAAGATLGNYANYGAFLANNDRMFAMGGRFLTNIEIGQLREERIKQQQEDMQHKDFFARVLDLKEPNSVAAKTMFENPALTSTASMTASVTQAPMSTMSSAFTNLSRMFMPTTSAASNAFDYGVPGVGFSLAEINSDEAEADPYANATEVEADLPALNDEFGECFSIRVNDDSGEIETTDVADYIGRPDICDQESPRLLKYRLYLADMTVAQGLSCYSLKDEESCENLGFENEATSAEGDSLLGDPNLLGIVDIPPWLTPGSGCHESVADKAREMLQAASDAGIELRGSCWRSPERQIELRRSNCGTSQYDIYDKPANQCSPPTARPGSSNHEQGKAIDFSDMCYDNATCAPGTNPGYDWLTEHAAEYGFYKLNSEAWHWSVDGH